MDPARFHHAGPGPSSVAAASAATSSISSAPQTSTSTPRPKKRKSPETSTSALPGGAANRTMSSSSTTAPGDLSKVRAFAACRACRQKKVKCLPGPASAAAAAGGTGAAACQQCTLSGAECEYQPTRDRAAYSRAYVQDLSGRVQALEAMQTRLIPLLAAFEAAGGSLPASVVGAIGNGSGSRLLLRAKPDPDAEGGDGDGDGGDDREGDGDGDEAMSDGAGGFGAGGQGGSSGHHRRRRGGRGDPRSDDNNSDGEESRRFLADERGNFRWIGPSNTLSLLDSFAEASKELPSRVRYGPHYSDDEETPPDANADDSPPESHPYFTPVAGAGTVRAIPGVDSVTFPPRAVAETFVDAFFQDVHPVLPVVLEPDFRRRFKLIMDKAEMGDFGSLRPGPMSVLFAVFALGERVIKTTAAWQRERAKTTPHNDNHTVHPGEAEAGVIWFERAQVLHFSSINDIDIHQVQCLTLLSAFQASVNAMPNAWLLASQALRIAQDIGLHRTARSFKVSFKVKQLGARCWWAVYGLERLVSITLGRPLCVDDLDIDVAYPAEVDDRTIHSFGDALTEEVVIPEEAPEATMSGFIALTKLCKIAGRVAQLLYRPSNGRSVTDLSWSESQQRTIDKLHRLLQDWLEHEVPKKYKDASSSRSVSVMSAVLSNSYFAVMLTLHRNLLPSNPEFPRPKPPPNSQSLALCVEAARSVIHVASKSNVLVPISHHIAVFCQYLWSSAVILLLCEVRAKEQIVVDAVGAQVEACHDALQALEPVWPGCRKLRELLTDVEQRAKEVRANAALKGTAAAPVPKKRKSNAGDGARRPIPKPQASTDSSIGGTPLGGGSASASAAGGAASMPTSLPPSAFAHPALPLMPHATGLDGAFDLFDVGGMNFDGLEMLNAFTSDAWNAVPPAVSPLGSTSSPLTGKAHQQQQQQQPQVTVPSQLSPPNPNPTPPSLATASPSNASGAAAAVGAWFTHGLGPAAPSPAPTPAEFAEMWAQIGGTSFDWQADPSMPFQI